MNTPCGGWEDHFTSHHVIPQADGHLSLGSLAEVVTVHREEAGVSFARLMEESEC